MPSSILIVHRVLVCGQGLAGSLAQSGLSPVEVVTTPIEAAARLTPKPDGDADRWQNFDLIRPKSTTAKFTGGYQLAVTAHSLVTGPTEMSPSLPGAAWQTRNGVDPVTGAPNGFSVLRGDIANEGVEKFFNDEMR